MSYSNINSYCLSVMDGVCSLVNVTLIASYVSMSIRTKSSFLSSLIHGFFDCCVCVVPSVSTGWPCAHFCLFLLQSPLGVNGVCGLDAMFCVVEGEEVE